MLFRYTRNRIHLLTADVKIEKEDEQKILEFLEQIRGAKDKNEKTADDS